MGALRALALLGVCVGLGCAPRALRCRVSVGLGCVPRAARHARSRVSSSRYISHGLWRVGLRPPRPLLPLLVLTAHQVPCRPGKGAGLVSEKGDEHALATKKGDEHALATKVQTQSSACTSLRIQNFHVT